MREINEKKISIKEQEKKPYSSPKIDLIADVRKVTRGGGTRNADMGGQSPFGNPPSDPVFGPP